MKNKIWTTLFKMIPFLTCVAWVVLAQPELGYAETQTNNVTNTPNNALVAFWITFSIVTGFLVFAFLLV